jgi:zinc transport system substrate-binding protein
MKKNVTKMKRFKTYTAGHSKHTAFIAESKVRNLCLFAALVMLGACNARNNDNVISVTIEPERYFVEQIAGHQFTVNTVVPQNTDAETYDPTPRQMIRIVDSRAYLSVGGYLNFETTWLDAIKQNNPSLDIFDLSDGYQYIHEEGEQADHHHAGDVDPHIWSSISGGEQMAKNTLKALIEIDPAKTDYYRNNYNALMSEIMSLGDSIATMMAPLQGSAFLIYHQGLSYFARDYDLKQFSIEEGGKEPSPAHLVAIADSARKYDAGVIFVQAEYDVKNAEWLSDRTGCRIVVINPMSRDWPGQLRLIAKALSGDE